MAEFTPKAVKVEAFQYDGTTEMRTKLAADVNFVHYPHLTAIALRKNEQLWHLNVGDWIVREASGKVHIYDDATFREYFDPAE